MERVEPVPIKLCLSNEMLAVLVAGMLLKNETAKVNAKPNIKKNKPIRKILVDCFLNGIISL